MDDVGPTNGGFLARRLLFRNKADTAYTLDPVTFMGLLHTDFNGVEGGILPGVEIKVEISLTPQDFLLHVDKNDTEKYKISITDAKLSLPVATISSQMFTNMERLLEKQSAMYYLTRVQMTQRCIPANSLNYVSESLFSTNQLPSRLIIALLPTSTMMGDKHKSPFNFQREFPSASVEGGGWAFLGGGDVEDGAAKATLTKVGLYLNGRSIDGWESEASEVSADFLLFELLI